MIKYMHTFMNIRSKSFQAANEARNITNNRSWRLQMISVTTPKVYKIFYIQELQLRLVYIQYVV